MADTVTGHFEKVPCSDCGDAELGEVCYNHWGPLVPPGEVGYFGPSCMAARDREWRAGFAPRPLGTEPRNETPSVVKDADTSP